MRHRNLHRLRLVRCIRRYRRMSSDKAQSIVLESRYQNIWWS